MFVVIQHQINDPKAFREAGEKMMKQVPSNLKGLQFFPSTDGKHATCLWEGATVEAVSTFVERNLAKFARNEYFQVSERDAMGLPHAQGIETQPTV